MRTFVEKVGGEHVDARVMVQPGYSPHTYHPTPRQIGALAEADLYVRAGLAFEDSWMDRILSANPEMQVLDARGGMELRPLKIHEHDGGEEHDAHQGQREHGGAHDEHDPGHGDEEGHSPDFQHHESDPHVWTSPLLVKHMIGSIRDKLAELDPLHAAEFKHNHDTYAAELDALDGEIRLLLAGLHNRRFMVFHPAWGYFADTYGLVQVPIERQGKEPGARSLAGLIDQAKQENIRVVFVQPQFDKRQVRQVARAIGGGVVAVDPLAPNYIDNLREVARQFAEVVQSRPTR